FVAELAQPLGELRVAVEDLEDVLTDFVGAKLGFQHVLALPNEEGGAPSEVRFENLTDVHTRGNAERIEDDVDRAAVLEVRHVLLGKDPADDAPGSVADCHTFAQ